MRARFFRGRIRERDLRRPGVVDDLRFGIVLGAQLDTHRFEDRVARTHQRHGNVGRYFGRRAFDQRNRVADVNVKSTDPRIRKCDPSLLSGIGIRRGPSRIHLGRRIAALQIKPHASVFQVLGNDERRLSEPFVRNAVGDSLPHLQAARLDLDPRRRLRFDQLLLHRDRGVKRLFSRVQPPCHLPQIAE